MLADFEQLTYDAAMLKNSWATQLNKFRIFANNGSVPIGMVYIIQSIYNSVYSEQLFAGASMFTLLISRPKNGRLNYQQTLSIKFESLTGLYNMQYSDWDLISDPSDWKKAIVWTCNCVDIEMDKNFFRFMEANKQWAGKRH